MAPSRRSKGACPPAPGPRPRRTSPRRGPGRRPSPRRPNRHRRGPECRRSTGPPRRSSRGAAGSIRSRQPCRRASAPGPTGRSRKPAPPPAAASRSSPARFRDPCGAWPGGRRTDPHSKADTSERCRASFRLWPSQASPVSSQAPPCSCGWSHSYGPPYPTMQVGHAPVGRPVFYP